MSFNGMLSVRMMTKYDIALIIPLWAAILGWLNQAFRIQKAFSLCFERYCCWHLVKASKNVTCHRQCRV